LCSRILRDYSSPCLLILVALACKWIASAMLAARTGLVDYSASSYIADSEGAKDAAYYLLHGVSLLAFIFGGALAFRTHWKILPKWALLAFFLLQSLNVMWTSLELIDHRYSSLWELAGDQGPLVWLSALGLFAGLDRRLWPLLESLLRALAIMAIPLLLFAFVRTRGGVRVIGPSSSLQLLILAWWPVAWAFLASAADTGWSRYKYHLSFGLLILVAALCQSRSWVINTVLLLPMRYWLSYKASIKNLRLKQELRSEVLLSLIGLCLVAGLIFSVQPAWAHNAWFGLRERLTEDTRTEQYEWFFDSVDLGSLLLGWGPNATWDFGDTSDYLYFDNFYLLAMFRGGVPLLLSYIVLVLVPGVLGISRAWSGPGLCAALILLLWGIMLGGVSTFVAPFLTFYNFVVYLLAGRCYLTINEKTNLSWHYTSIWKEPVHRFRAVPIQRVPRM
jgi:hypothetical protein